MKKLPREEIKELSIYLEGLADADPSSPKYSKLKLASKWLDILGDPWHICSQGYIGCRGDNCTSDHK